MHPVHVSARRDPTLLGSAVLGVFVGGALLVGVPAVLVTIRAVELAAAARRRAGSLDWRDLL